jgi:hypothetical protein
MNAVNTPEANEQTRLAKAVGTAFLWNTVGNCLGWGSLLCLIIPSFMTLGFGLGITILPIAVPLILLLNLIVGLMLLSAKISQGIAPKFNKPPIYFVIGAISSILFFIGSIIFIIYYRMMLSNPSPMPD